MEHVNFTGTDWTQHPERLSREQLVGALSLLDQFTVSYALGQVNGGVKWEHLDECHEKSIKAFPGLYPAKLAEAKVIESDEDEAEAEEGAE